MIRKPKLQEILKGVVQAEIKEHWTETQIHIKNTLKGNYIKNIRDNINVVLPITPFVS